MNLTTLRNTLLHKRHQHTTLLLSLVTVFIVSNMAMESASALYVLSGLDEDVLVLDESTDLSTVDISSKLVQVGASRQGVDVTLTAGQTLTVQYQGATIYAQTQDETISQLLARLNISLAPLEMVMLDFAGECPVLTISDTLSYFETVEEVAPYETQRIANPSMAQGEELVTQAGVNGQRQATYEVVYANGSFLSRQLVDAQDSPTVPEIVEYGTKVPTIGIDDPLKDVITNQDGSGYLLFASGQTLSFSSTKPMTATAYTTGDPGVGTITASGTVVHVGVAAVDKKVIPLGTRMFVVTNDGIVYGTAVAEDTGSAVRDDIIDLYHDTHTECINFGRRSCTVYFLD